MMITITIIYHNQNHYHNYLGDSIWAAAGTILAALSRALHVMNNLMIVNVMLVNVLNVKNMIININIMIIVSLAVNFIILNNKKS